MAGAVTNAVAKLSVSRTKKRRRCSSARIMDRIIVFKLRLHVDRNQTKTTSGAFDRMHSNRTEFCMRQIETERHILILNGGSSSLKFAVRESPWWTIASRAETATT